MILGLHLPALDLFAYCHRYAKQPHIAVIACSPYADGWLFQQDIAFAGAKACFTQQVNQNKLLNCINIVSNGVCMFDTEALAAAHMPIHLTERELDVLRCFTQDMTDQQIAEELRLSPNNVRNIGQRVREKLAVQTREEAKYCATKFKASFK